MKHLFNIILLAFSMLAIVSCSTLEGVGLNKQELTQLAKEWIIKQVNDYGVPKTSPVILQEAATVEDSALREEIVTQLTEK